MGSRNVSRVISDARLRNQWKSRYWNMVRRCTDTAAKDYPRYGGKGVTVCDEWLADPESFYRHAVTLLNWDYPWLQLDRIDNEKGYEPGNVRLVTRSRNMRNRRNTFWVTFNGIRMPVSDFIEMKCPDWSRQKVYNRLRGGQTTESLAEEYYESKQ